MSFNPDTCKQAREVVFSRKINRDSHPDIIFNNTVVKKTLLQKHLGIWLDNKLMFNEHLTEKFGKANKVVGILRKLRNYLTRSTLLTIYKILYQVSFGLW